MIRRIAIELGCVTWAIVGLVVALSGLAQVNADARPFMTIVSIVLPLAACGAAYAVARGHMRVAGVLLLVSAGTPTYFAYALNIPAAILGLALTVLPGRIVHSEGTYGSV